MKQKWIWLTSIPLAILASIILIGCQQRDIQLAATTLFWAIQSSNESNSPTIQTDEMIETDLSLDLDKATYVPSWEETECQYHPNRTETMACGYVLVPENRLHPTTASAKLIRLYITIIHSRSENPAPDPIIYLSGGPGGRTFPFIRSISGRFDATLAERDLILFDQRGIHLSEPTLDCPEIVDWKMTTLDQSLTRTEVVAGNIATNLACLERLKQAGIDIAAYTSAASAADINDIRIALGYEQINLYGVSYGSRLALTAMRDLETTGTVRSVILDSVYSPPEDLFIGLSPNAQRVFDLLFTRCATDTACQTAYPDIEETYYDLVAQLTQQPVIIEVSGRSRDAEPFIMSLDGDDMIRLLFNMMYDTKTIPKVPLFITQMAAGDYSNRSLQGWLRWLIISGEFFSEGMWYSVMCGEEAHFGTEDLVRASAVDVHPAIQGYFIDLALTIDYSTCDNWGAHPANPVENEAVSSNIPTLVLAGEFDPITPPAWSQRAAETLSQVHYLEFPDVGHGVLLARQCARDITAAFISQPNYTPDTTCLAEMPQLSFVISE